MRLAFYECSVADCKGRFLGASGQVNEHCGRQAVHITEAAQRCEAVTVVQLGTAEDIRKGRLTRHVPRGFWRHAPGTPVSAAILKEQFADRDSAPVLHVHRCTEADGHIGDHLCTCDYAWR